MNSTMNIVSALFISVVLATLNHIQIGTSSFTHIKEKLNHLSHEAPQLDKKVLNLALKAYQKAEAKGEVKNHKLTVIDYSLPSNKERMWVFDLDKERLLYNTYVAHGANSGQTVPHHFSNSDSSHATSLGTFVTKDTYDGHNGVSLNLKGLEKGINDHAYARRVVVHGAWYMDPSFIKKTGRAGRSWGCPAVAASLAKPIINTIKEGSVIFAFYPDKQFLNRSTFLA